MGVQDRSVQDRASSADIVGFGLALGATGFYFILVGFGVLPTPGGEDALNAPLVIVGCGSG